MFLQLICIYSFSVKNFELSKLFFVFTTTSTLLHCFGWQVNDAVQLSSNMNNAGNYYSVTQM